jgi:hypothetical protein
MNNSFQVISCFSPVTWMQWFWTLLAPFCIGLILYWLQQLGQCLQRIKLHIYKVIVQDLKYIIIIYRIGVSFGYLQSAENIPWICPASEWKVSDVLSAVRSLTCMPFSSDDWHSQKHPAHTQSWRSTWKIDYYKIIWKECWFKESGPSEMDSSGNDIRIILQYLSCRYLFIRCVSRVGTKPGKSVNLTTQHKIPEESPLSHL